MRHALPIGVLGALLGLPGSAWAGAVPGARYEGKVADGTRSSLTVSRDGQRLRGYDLYSKTRCSNGVTNEVGLFEIGERPVLIRADGSFSYRSRPFRLRLQRNRYRGSFRVRAVTTVSGQFDPSGDIVQGTLRTVYTSRRLHCDTGTDSFTLYRQGTSQAPYRSRTIATGSYRVRGRSIRGLIRATAGGPTLPLLRIRYVIPCRRGGYAVTVTPFRPYLQGSVFQRGIIDAYRERGERVKADTFVRGRFFYAGGYRLRGRLRARHVFYRHGRRTNVCRGALNFTGRFSGGPVGPEGPHPGH